MFLVESVHKIYWEMARGLIKMQWKGARAIDRARARVSGRTVRYK